MIENSGRVASSRHVKISNKDFKRLSEIVSKKSGIKMPESKIIMLESRLQKRLRIIGIDSFNTYCDYLFSKEGISNELNHMIDSVTTNKTDFFRESAHFNYLVKFALPDLMKNHGVGIRKKLTIWSAGCSTGEEPYTLAMVLSDFAEKNPELKSNFSILATDISTKVLESAKSGIYEENRIETISPEMRRKYLLRSKDRSQKLIKIAPEIRSLVTFRRLNFMDPDFGIRESIDIIFCRNVIIYFEKQTQLRLMKRFCNYLKSDRYLFMGTLKHSMVLVCLWSKNLLRFIKKFSESAYK